MMQDSWVDSGSSPPQDNWTWPFELEGPTLTNTLGPTAKGFRRPNDWIGDLRFNPTYPVYVISKGRWEMRKTSKVLERMQVPYHIVIEPQEERQYQQALKSTKYATIRVLPFSNLGLGGIPARNWVWEDSLKRGAKRHWILDDNLHCFQRLHRQEKQRLWTGAGFKALEDFVDRYSNVALAGPQYIGFADAKKTKVPYRLNTRIYSCILINNELLPFEKYQWRGRYNEDTDLSIRVLKDGWVTVLSNAFLVDKTTTMRNTGGNTTELYDGDGNAATRNTDTEGRKQMAESLRTQHPDIVNVGRKFNRWQHSVNYKGFKTALMKVNPFAPEIVYEYGLTQETPITKFEPCEANRLVEVRCSTITSESNINTNRICLQATQRPA
jgi:hypothetical protein